MAPLNSRSYLQCAGHGTAAAHVLMTASCWTGAKQYLLPHTCPHEETYTACEIRSFLGLGFRGNMRIRQGAAVRFTGTDLGGVHG